MIFQHFRELTQDLWGEGFALALRSSPSPVLFHRAVAHLAMMIAPTLLAVLVVAVAINLVQTKGLLISLKAIQFSFSKLNPLQGAKQLFSIRSLVELVKSVCKIAIISFALYQLLHTQRHALLPLAKSDVVVIAGFFGQLSLKMLSWVLVIMLALSLADFFYQKWQFQKDLMMTKQEVKEEAKQSEGNPQIKSRIRSLQRALARQRMMAKVPKATVVITNPTHYAVALQYNQQMEAPKVIAKGVDIIALRIIKIARKNRVPVVQNPPLARALYKQVKLEKTIPLTLYRAVAKVLAYIYQQQKRAT